VAIENVHPQTSLTIEQRLALRSEETRDLGLYFHPGLMLLHKFEIAEELTTAVTSNAQ
jgi:hypothetical protein